MSRLTGSVGRWSPPPVAWKARISASHARTGASQPGKLRHLDAIAPPVEALQRGASRRRAGRGVDGPRQLLALAAGWRGKWSTTTLRPRVETGGGSPARFGHRARPGGDPAERLKNRRRASGGVFWLPWDFAPRKELGSQRLSGSNAALSPKQRKLIWA